MTFAVVAGVLLCAWSVFAADLGARDRRERRILAEQTALRLQDWIAARLLVLGSIRAIRAQGLLNEPVSWRRRISADMETVGGFQAINWIDRGGVIAITAPAEGNEDALGRNVRDHAVAGPVFARAEASGTVQVSPPLELFQGGRGFTAYVPVRTADQRIAGYVNGVFRLEAIMSTVLADLDPGRLRVSVTDEGSPVWGSWDPGVDVDDGATGSLRVGDRRWVLRVERVAPVLALPVHLGVAGGVLLVGGLAGLGVVTMLRQAADAAEARREAARIAVRVRELERMESLGRVVGGIAHDFNNILSVVVGRASMLELQLGDNPAAQADVDAILDAGDRASELIETLLTFSGRREDGGGQVDAAAHLRALEPLLRHVAGRGVVYRQRIEVEHAVIAMAPTALDRVVINLVSNAQQAIAGGDGHIELRLSPAEGGCTLSVIDDGRGMNAETRARIFEPFFTTRPNGTGLGLASVFGLVTDAGGRFDVDSAPGRGTRFRVHLPEAGSQRASKPST